MTEGRKREDHVRRMGFLFTFLLAGLGWCGYRCTTNPARIALSWRATDIREYSWEEGFLPDFSYVLRAKVERAEFDAFVREMDLPRLGPRSRETPQEDEWETPVGCDSDTTCRFWQPDQYPAESYGHREGRAFQGAQFKDGYLYYSAWQM